MLVCVVIKEFFLDIAFPSLLPLERPLAVALTCDEGTSVVAACGATALRSGIHRGMPESEARALCPKGLFAFVDLPSAEEAFAKALNALESFSPTIESLGIGSALLDFGVMPDSDKTRKEVKKLITFLERKLRHVASVGVGEGRFVATVAANGAGPGQAIIVAAGEESDFLHAQPTSCLPISRETSRRLELLGVYTVGDIAKLPQDDLANLFGNEGCLMASLAHGKDEALVSAERLVEALTRSVSYDFPVEGGELLFGDVMQMVGELCTQLQEKHLMATRIRIKLEITGQKDLSILLNLASPTQDASRIEKTLKDRFQTLTLSGQIDSVEVALEGFVESHARQLTLDTLLPKAERWRNIRRIVERLAIRDDPTALMRVIWDDAKSRIPERRAHLQDIVRETLRRGLYLPKPVNVTADGRGTPQLVRTVSGWQPVDSIVEAWEVDDDWWTPRPIARSYYRVLLRNGAMMRLFRDQRRGSWYHQSR